jgi:hypothetical protein
VAQPTPTVDDRDVERVVRRDYPPARVAEVLSLIASVDFKEKSRTALACLKLADGDVGGLLEQLARAETDYRDVLSGAEYPLAFPRWNEPGLSAEEREAIYRQDWAQYTAWLHRA